MTTSVNPATAPFEPSPSFNLQDPSAAGGRVKVAARPIAITRQSNDFFTNLTKHSTVHPVSDTDDNMPSMRVSHSAGDLLSQAPPEKKVMTSRYPAKNQWRIVGACMWSFVSGFSDAAPGALLPTMEAHYSISYSVVSLIWMCNAVGFILVALFSNRIQPWFGREKSIPLGCLCSSIMYAMVGSGGPFPLVVCGFVFGGVGIAVVLSQTNVFMSKLENNSKYLSVFHGMYGFGATVSPFLATTMVEHNVHWNYVYLIMLGLMLVNLVTLTWAFRGADEDLKYWDNDEQSDTLNARHPASNGEPQRATEDELELQEIRTQTEYPNGGIKTSSLTSTGNMRIALKNDITWKISFFLLFYQGCEVALGGWIVSYLIDYRHTSTSYGYVLSGFWGGLTLGRLFLTRPLHTYLGVRKSVDLLVLGTIVTIVLTWVIPNDIVLSVFVSIAGTLIGPMYPLMITGVSLMLPRKIQVVSLTIMTAFGSSGGAILPLFVGLISQTAGTFVVLPICIAGYTLVLVFWLLLPKSHRKLEHPRSRIMRIFNTLW